MMKFSVQSIFYFISIFIIIWSVNACKKDKPKAGIDKELYDKAQEAAGFVWYKNSSVFLPKSAGSGHSQAFLRTRYNAIAAAQLNSSGQVLPNAVFAEGSLIVKELYNNTSKLDRYAILFKNSASEHADAKGWVWGYINADGTVAEPASNKGSACINCHSQTNQIAYTLMNAYFP